MDDVAAEITIGQPMDDPQEVIVTIACPPGFKHDLIVDPCPIWLDARGIEYRIASGAAVGLAATDGPATPDRVSIIVGLNGLTALRLMGLTRKADKE